MRSLGWRVSAVFVVATAVISQGLAWLRGAFEINSEVVAPAQYGPALAALVTWMIFRRRIAEVMPSPVSSRQLWGRIVLAVTACVLFAILVWIGYSAIGGESTSGLRGIDGWPFWLIAVVWLSGATAEEVGWRGVLQPALETALPRWGAGIVTGLVWSVWHLPVITQGAAVASVFIASTTVLAVLMAYLGNGSPVQRVVTTSVLHWLINLAILIVSGSGTDLAELIPELVAISLTTTVVLTLIAVITRRSRTSGRHFPRDPRTSPPKSWGRSAGFPR